MLKEDSVLTTCPVMEVVGNSLRPWILKRWWRSCIIIQLSRVKWTLNTSY